MNYLQNKPPHQWNWCGGKKSCALIILWLALLALVFFNKSYALLQNTAVRATMFLLPERAALRESVNNLMFLEQLGALRLENQRLKEALGAQGAGKSSFIPARIRFGGDYLFVDSFFLDEGLSSGVLENNVVLAEGGILVGRVVAAGDSWSKVEKTGSLGQKLALSSPDYNLSFEAVGLGGGEFLAELPARIVSAFKPGDILRDAENADYIAAVVDKIDFSRNDPFGKLFMAAPASFSASAWVKIIPNND